MASGDKETKEEINFLSLVEDDNVEVCRKHLQKFPDAIRDKNQKGETALHIAARNPNLCIKVNMLLDEGADANTKNFWGQTPLHYAAQARSADIIHRLLNANVDIGCKDANGYTALHYLAISSQKIDSEWRKCFEKFNQAGIDINATTNFGRSILHLVSTLYDGLEFLRYIFRCCPGVDIFSVDLEGKNFLHIFSEYDIERIFGIIQIVANCQEKENVRALLNQKDFYGIAPWFKFVNSSFISSKAIEQLITSYDVNLNSQDNMKNTALHMLAKTGTEQSCEHMETLMKLGINVNLKNIFGQTALSLLYSENTLDVFMKYSLDWDTCDRWNRTPFHEILFEDCVPTLMLEKMLLKNGQYVDKQDIYHSAPLHFAAYKGDAYKIKLLMKYTKAKFAVDKMNDIPSDTALRHGNLKCYHYFLKSSMAFENRNRKSLLYKAPSFVRLSVFVGKEDIRKLLQDFPKDMKTLSNHLLMTKRVSNKQSFEHLEDTEIVLAVNELVSRICDYVNGYDARFKMAVFRTGSTAEGTKVGRPDEFDFALCVETLSQHCEMVTPKNIDQCQFVCLRFKENAISEYISFSDEKRFFIPLPFLHYLLRYIRRALKETDLWVNGNLFIRPADTVRVLAEKPVFNFNIYWNGSKYKQLQISIDLVPVVYSRGWWPSFITINARKLITDGVKDAGCFILLQAKLNEFGKQCHDTNDNINTTCKQNEEHASKQVENKDHLLLRISVAPAEIALMKSLPEQFREAYTLAKIVKSKEICPGVSVDVIPSYFDRNDFLPHVVWPSEGIKSYWLKNCTFYVAEEVASCEDKTPLDITILIYEKLLELATSCQLKAYLFPQSDVFTYEKNDTKLVKEVRTLLLTRKVCINTVLGILGRPFPEDNSEWTKSCETQYQQYNSTDEQQLQTSMRHIVP